MADIERFDFDGPPPGYYREPGSDLVRQGHGKARTLAEAWARWRAVRDPPGMETREWTGPDKAWIWSVVAMPERRGLAGSPEAARAAAWGWYGRRLALVLALEDVGVQLDLWPAALGWSEDECATIDAWLLRGPSWLPDDFPAVLRARAPLYSFEEPIHLCDWAQQPDIRIACTQEMTQPKWGHEGRPFKAENGALYTFVAAKVTCPKCQEKSRG